jgi:hypothetical protein
MDMKTMRALSVVMVLVFAAASAFAQAPAGAGGLTYGTATKMIKKGETTQTEIIQAFGAPNITTVSKKGEEVWTYDRISYTQSSQGGADTKMILLGGAAGAGLGAIIGNQSKSLGKGALLGGILGAIGGWLWGHANPVYEQGSKTATLMLWFDENKVVKEYSITTTQF